MKKIYIGTSGWSYDHWKEVFYPGGVSKTKWLSFYAEHFNSVEVNMTFYRTPSEKAMAGWMEKTPDDFAFTLKAPRILTHIKRFHDIDDSLGKFYDTVSFMKEKTACILFQMPPSFHMSSENMTRLEHVLEISETDCDLAFEFRDSSWWHEDVYGILEGRGVFCSVYGFDMPDDLIVSSKRIYARFHGEDYSVCYTESFLSDFASHVKGIDKKNNPVSGYFYFNNDALGYSVQNALDLKNNLNL